MARPLYEDEQDLNGENAFKEKIEQYLKASLMKMPKKYCADYMVFRNNAPVAIIEVKIRNVSRNTYITYMLSLHKVLYALNMASMLMIPFFVFVKWTDAMGYCQIMEGHLATIEMQNVNFRDDPDDIEPCIFVPISTFKLMF